MNKKIIIPMIINMVNAIANAHRYFADEFEKRGVILVKGNKPQRNGSNLLKTDRNYELTYESILKQKLSIVFVDYNTAFIDFGDKKTGSFHPERLNEDLVLKILSSHLKAYEGDESSNQHIVFEKEGLS